MSTAEGGNALSDSGEELSSCKGGRPEGIVGQRDNLATASQGLGREARAGAYFPSLRLAVSSAQPPGSLAASNAARGLAWIGELTTTSRRRRRPPSATTRSHARWSPCSARPREDRSVWSPTRGWRPANLRTKNQARLKALCLRVSPPPLDFCWTDLLLH